MKHTRLTALILTCFVTTFIYCGRIDAEDLHSVVQSAASCNDSETYTFEGHSSMFDTVEISVSSNAFQEVDKSRSTDYGRAFGVDPSGAWIIDENGELSRGDRKYAAPQLMLRAVLCNAITFLPSRSTSPNSFGVAQGFGLVQVRLDASTGLISSIASTNGAGTNVLTILSFQRLPDGKLVPFSWDDGHRVFFADHVTAHRNTALTVGSVNWPTLKAIQKRSETKLFFVRGHPALQASLPDGTAASCVIDTGTTGFTVSSDLANYIDQRHGDESSVYTPKGRLVLPRGRLAGLTVAGSFLGRPVATVDSRLPPRTILCGDDYLRLSTFTIDFRNNQATIDAADLSQCMDCLTIADYNGIFGQVFIGGSAYEAMFDSGLNADVYAGILAFHSIAAAINTSSMVRPSDSVCVSTMNCIATMVTVARNSVPTSVKLYPSSPWPIRIGSNFLQRFASVTIDLKNKRLEFVQTHL